MILPPPEPFTLPVVTCPSCGHGIDPHKAWREPCGTGMLSAAEGATLCPCLWTPNDIAATRQIERGLAAIELLREQVDALVSMGDPDWDETRQFVWKDEVLALLHGGGEA